MLERIQARAKLVRPLIIPFLLYIAVLWFSITWLDRHPASGWRIPVALLPLLPGLLAALGVVRAIRRLDELERKELLEGMTISFACTFVLTFSLGLLSTAGFKPINPVFIALFMALTWLVGKLWAMRKYR